MIHDSLEDNIDTLPTLADVAAEAARAADLAAQWRQLRPVPPGWDLMISWDDDEQDGCYKRLTDTVQLADAVLDTLLIALATGAPDRHDCERMAAILRAHDPALEDRDLLAFPVRLMRAGYEITCERVSDGYGCAGVLRRQQDEADKILVALATPVQTAEELEAVYDVVSSELIFSGEARAAIERFIATQPLLQVDPRSIADRERRFQVDLVQRYFQSLQARMREDSGEAVD